MSNFKFQSKNVAYTAKGEGEAVLFLHGYLESKEVWESFSSTFEDKYKVITMDIPGHGKSETITYTHHMTLLADVVNELLKHLNINKVHLVGHSMGGYVALAFANKYKNNLRSLSLLHSSIFADSEEKKDNRAKEMLFIQQDKLPLILKINLPKMLANHHIIRFSKQIGEISERAANFDIDGICALLRGMMLRRDMTNFIKDFDLPLLFVFGEQDNYIPVEIAKEMLTFNHKAEELWLANSGHLGFIEEADKTAATLENFWSK